MLQFLVLFTLGTQLTLNWKSKFKMSTALNLLKNVRAYIPVELLTYFSPTWINHYIFWLTFQLSIGQKNLWLWATDWKLVYRNYDVIVLWAKNCLQEDIFLDDYIKIAIHFVVVSECFVTYVWWHITLWLAITLSLYVQNVTNNDYFYCKVWVTVDM